MKTREEFVKQWQATLTGVALFGLVSELRDSTLHRATRAMELPQEMQALLGRMYDSLQAGESREKHGMKIAK